jgi:hypothetical protein
MSSATALKHVAVYAALAAATAAVRLLPPSSSAATLTFSSSLIVVGTYASAAAFAWMPLDRRRGGGGDLLPTTAAATTAAAVPRVAQFHDAASATLCTVWLLWMATGYAYSVVGLWVPRWLEYVVGVVDALFTLVYIAVAHPYWTCPATVHRLFLVCSTAFIAVPMFTNVVGAAPLAVLLAKVTVAAAAAHVAARVLVAARDFEASPNAVAAVGSFFAIIVHFFLFVPLVVVAVVVVAVAVGVRLFASASSSLPPQAPTATGVVGQQQLQQQQQQQYALYDLKFPSDSLAAPPSSSSSSSLLTSAMPPPSSMSYVDYSSRSVIAASQRPSAVPRSQSPVSPPLDAPRAPAYTASTTTAAATAHFSATCTCTECRAIRQRLEQRAHVQRF